MGKEYLRPVEWSDMDLLYEWANDKSVRDNSFNSEIISYIDHKRWFEKSMSDDNVIIYILCDTNSEIGQIRLDCCDNTAKINYSISKKYRGFGYGTNIVRLAEQKLVIDKPYINYLEAFVKNDNAVSLKVFKRNGYTLTPFEHGAVYLCSKELSILKKEG